jgi:hypothetical protein
LIQVYYWDGSVPEARMVRDVSTIGAFIVTKEHWYDGTIVRLLFRGYVAPSPPDTNVVPSQSITVSSRVVRQESNGVAVEFLFPTPKDRAAFSTFLATIQQMSSTLTLSPPSTKSVPGAS